MQISSPDLYRNRNKKVGVFLIQVVKLTLLSISAVHQTFYFNLYLNTACTAHYNMLKYIHSDLVIYSPFGSIVDFSLEVLEIPASLFANLVLLPQFCKSRMVHVNCSLAFVRQFVIK